MTTHRKAGQSVGQTNGRIAWLFRLNQVLHPYIVLVVTLMAAFTVWMINSTVANNAQRESMRGICDELSSLENKVRELPPAEYLKERLNKLDATCDTTTKDMQSIKMGVHDLQRDMDSLKEHFNLTTHPAVVDGSGMLPGSSGPDSGVP